jgi:hypothetical protein
MLATSGSPVYVARRTKLSLSSFTERAPHGRAVFRLENQASAANQGGRHYGCTARSQKAQKKFLLFSNSTTLKPAGMLSGRTVHDRPSGIESSAEPVFPHAGHLRISIQRSRVVIA